MATEDRYLEAISEFRVLLATLKNDGQHWDTQKNGACGAFFRATTKALHKQQIRISEDLRISAILLKALDKSECNEFDNELINQNRTSAFDAARQLLANIDQVKDQVLEKSIEKFESGTREPRIFKRDIGQKMKSSEVLATLKKLELFDLDYFTQKRKVCQNLATNLSSSDVDRCLALRQCLTSEAAFEAGQGISAQDTPVKLDIESIAMNVQRIYPNLLENTTIRFPDDFSSVRFMADELFIKATDTICMATSNLKTDFVTNCSESFNPMGDATKLLNVFYMKFCDEPEKNPSNKRNKRSVSDTGSGGMDLNVDLNVPIDDVFQNTHLACFLLVDGVWNSTYCDVKGVTTSGKFAQVHCQCQSDGYLAVGLVSNSNSDIEYIEEVFAFKENIKFKIDENYADWVEGSEKDFKSAILSQLMQILDCDRLNIRDLAIYPGSIIIEFLLVGADKMEAEQLKQSHHEMVALLAAGELKLEAFNGSKTQSLNVPKQCMKNCEQGVLLPEEDLTLLIIGSIILGIVCLVLICIIVGVCVKKRKRDEKLQRIAMPKDEMTPSYRAMAFTENMEGTADSLVKYRRNPTFVTSSPMMPLPAAYQVDGALLLAF